MDCLQKTYLWALKFVDYKYSKYRFFIIYWNCSLTFASNKDAQMQGLLAKMKNIPVKSTGTFIIGCAQY
jgi:hypothetical protein